MHPEMPQLYALHEVDARLLQLDRALHNLDNGDRGKAALLAARQELARRDDALKRARVALAEAESSLKSNEAKQVQLGKRLYGGSVTSQREAEAAEHEIAALKSAAGDLETAILELMDTIEAAEGAAKEQAAAVAKAESDLKATLEAYAKDTVAIRAQAAQAEAKRAGAAAPISAPVMARYDSARRRTKDTGVTIVEGKMCTACRMQVAGMNLTEFASTENLVACDNCGRLLYRQT